MSRYLIDYLSTTLHESKAAPQSVEETHCVLWFFCNTEMPNRNSSKGLIWSLVYQTLHPRHNWDLFQHLDKKYCTTAGGYKFVPDIVEEDLWDFLLSISQNARNKRFWLVIDALDELNDDSFDILMTRIRSILTRDLIGRTKFLVTARNGPTKSEGVDHTPDYLDISLNHEDTQQDVETFIRAEVDTLVRRVARRCRITEANAARFEVCVRSASQGNFLNAKLAIAYFQFESESYTREKFENRLQAFSVVRQDVESYYCGLLRQIPQIFRASARDAMLLVLVAVEPLTFAQLSFAVAIKRDHRSAHDVDRDIDVQSVTAFSACCGFLLRQNARHHIEFSHQTVKELILGTEPPAPENMDILPYFRCSLEDAQRFMSNICLFIFKWPAVDSATVYHIATGMITDVGKIEQPREAFDAVCKRLRFPTTIQYFLAYGSHHLGQTSWPIEATQDLLHFFTSQAALLVRLLRYYIDTSTFLEIPTGTLNVVAFGPREPPMKLAVQTGDFPHLLRTMISSGIDVNEQDHRGFTALDWTIARDRSNSFHVLLNMMNGHSQPYTLPRPYTSLHLAVVWLRAEMVEHMSNHSEIDVNALSDSGLMPLAIANGLYEITNLRSLCTCLAISEDEARLRIHDVAMRLLTARDRIDAQSLWDSMKTFMLPLDVIREMLELKNQHSIRSGHDRIPLATLAQRHNWESVEIDIARRRAWDLFVVDQDGLDILMRYAYYGEKSRLVRVLDSIDKEAWPRQAYTTSTFNLVHLCANQDWPDVVLMLLTKFEAQDLDSDHDQRTLLHWAVDYNWDLTMLPLESKLHDWFDQQDTLKQTALHIAVVQHNIDAIKILLARGANMLLQNVHGRNPVHLAAEEGMSAVLEPFLHTATTDFGRTRDGATMLHLMAMWSQRSSVEKLMRTRNPDLETRDKDGSTPLHYAAQFGNSAATVVLLERGAKVVARTKSGMTALHLAIREGHVAVASVLVDYGAQTGVLDGFRQSCFQLAIRTGNEAMLEMIIYHNKVVNHQDCFRKTALHRACSLGAPSVILRVLELQPDCTLVDCHNQTALHLAASSGDTSSLQIVLDYMTRRKTSGINARDVRGRTPLDWTLFHKNVAAQTSLQHEGGRKSHEWQRRFPGEQPYNQNCAWDHLQENGSSLLCHFIR